MITYFYSIMAFVSLIIWILLYNYSVESRRPIFWTSWTFAAGGPICEYWNRTDYWHPPYLIDIIIGNWHFGIEDFIFTFSIIGISAAIFEKLAIKKGMPSLPGLSKSTYLKLKFWGVIGIGLFLFTVTVGLKSIAAIILTFVILSFIIQYKYWNIFLLAIGSAVIFTVLYWLYCIIFLVITFPHAIETYWKLNNTWGIMITGIPIEEFMWAFIACLFTGPIYRVCSTKTWFGKY